MLFFLFQQKYLQRQNPMISKVVIKRNPSLRDLLNKSTGLANLSKPAVQGGQVKVKMKSKVHMMQPMMTLI